MRVSLALLFLFFSLLLVFLKLKSHSPSRHYLRELTQALNELGLSPSDIPQALSQLYVYQILGPPLLHMSKGKSGVLVCPLSSSQEKKYCLLAYQLHSAIQSPNIELSRTLHYPDAYLLATDEQQFKVLGDTEHALKLEENGALAELNEHWSLSIGESLYAVYQVESEQKLALLSPELSMLQRLQTLV